MPHILDQLTDFRFQDQCILNFEMETAAIYALAGLLGHHCLSLSAVISQRHHKRFSHHPQQTVAQLIERVLQSILHNQLSPLGG